MAGSLAYVATRGCRKDPSNNGSRPAAPAPAGRAPLPAQLRGASAVLWPLPERRATRAAAAAVGRGAARLEAPGEGETRPMRAPCCLAVDRHVLTDRPTLKKGFTVQSREAGPPGKAARPPGRGTSAGARVAACRLARPVGRARAPSGGPSPARRRPPKRAGAHAPPATLQGISWPAHMGTTLASPRPYSSGMTKGRRSSVSVPLLRGSP
jgi:hypothetical protein